MKFYLFKIRHWIKYLVATKRAFAESFFGWINIENFHFAIYNVLDHILIHVDNNWRWRRIWKRLEVLLRELSKFLFGGRAALRRPRSAQLKFSSSPKPFELKTSFSLNLS